MLSSVSVRSPAPTRPACTPASRQLRAPRRASLQVVNIGNINDPEKTKADKEKKATESSWAEPHNKNPLEKKPILRGEPGNASETEGNPLEGAKEAVEGAVDKAKEAAEEAKDAVSGGKD